MYFYSESFAKCEAHASAQGLFTDMSIVSDGFGSSAVQVIADDGNGHKVARLCDIVPGKDAVARAYEIAFVQAVCELSGIEFPDELIKREGEASAAQQKAVPEAEAMVGTKDNGIRLVTQPAPATPVQASEAPVAPQAVAPVQAAPQAVPQAPAAQPVPQAPVQQEAPRPAPVQPAVTQPAPAPQAVQPAPTQPVQQTAPQQAQPTAAAPQGLDFLVNVGPFKASPRYFSEILNENPTVLGKLLRVRQPSNADMIAYQANANAYLAAAGITLA